MILPILLACAPVEIDLETPVTQNTLPELLTRYLTTDNIPLPLSSTDDTAATRYDDAFSSVEENLNNTLASPAYPSSGHSTFWIWTSANPTAGALDTNITLARSIPEH